MPKRHTVPGLFENDEAALAWRPLSFSPYKEPEFRSAVPLKLSPIPDDTNIAEAGITGAMLLGLPLKQQGKEIAAVLNATKMIPPWDGRSTKVVVPVPLYRRTVIEVARRSAKTTSIAETLLGRCTHRPGYKAVMTAQSGIMARKKFREFMDTLMLADFEGNRDPAKRLGTLYYSNGFEAIEFDNGSKFWVVPPDPGSFRSEAADVIWVDEAGELPVEKADALLAGALPLMDTRPEGQIIVSGTPNIEDRAGLLWNFRTAFLNGAPGYGGVIYAAKDSEVFADFTEDPENPVLDLELLKRVHPGIASGLTTVEIVLENLEPMGVRKFCCEYLCQWPKTAANSALDVEAWQACVSPHGLPPRPERIGLAFEVDKLGKTGVLMAAWRDDLGRANFEVLECRNGSDWLPAIAKQAQAKYRQLVGYDSIGSNIEAAERMLRPPNKVSLRPLKMAELIAAEARLEKEVSKRNVVHYNQRDLNDSVEVVSWRPAGRDGRLFMRAPNATGAGSSAPVVAAAEALWLYDAGTRPEGSGRRVRSADAILAERAARARQGAVA